jgi:hypothetical protein
MKRGSRSWQLRVWPLFAAAIVVGCASPHEERQPNSPPPGTAAPDFSLKALDGGFVSLSDHRGKPVLLAYWAVG